LNFEQNFPRLNLALMTAGRRSGSDLRRQVILPGRISDRSIPISSGTFDVAVVRGADSDDRAGISDMLGTLPLKCSAQAEAWIADWWTASLAGRHPIVAIHPGSYYMEFKRWPLERFIEFAEQLRSAPNLAIVLTGTPPAAAEFVSSLPLPDTRSMLPCWAQSRSGDCTAPMRSAE